jgi:hypothetical protein
LGLDRALATPRESVAAIDWESPSLEIAVEIANRVQLTSLNQDGQGI